jgi:hypothetical protein
MAGPSTRRPVPALVFLLALSLLSGLVWWRVLHRGDATHVKAKTTSSAASSAPPANHACTAKNGTVKALLPKADTVTISVLNATGQTGFAASASKKLAGHGFRVAGVGDDGNNTTAKLTQIRFGATSAAAAELLHITIPNSTLIGVNSPSSTVVVAVGSTFDSLTPLVQVSKKVAVPQVLPVC